MSGCHEQMLPAELITSGHPPGAALEALRNMVLATRYNGWRYIAVSVTCHALQLGEQPRRNCTVKVLCGFPVCWPALLA